MSEAFGAYDTAGASAHVPDGTYLVRAKSVQVVKRNGEPVRDVRSNKIKVAIVVAVAQGEHAGQELKRTTTIAYGQNSETGAYAAFAQFIEAVTGVKCGDPEQKKIGEAQIRDRLLSVTVLENSKGYADIVRFKPAPVANPPGDTLDQDLGHRAAPPRVQARAEKAAPPIPDPLGLLTEGQRNVIVARAKKHGIDIATAEGATLVRGITRRVMPGNAEQLDAAHMPAFLSAVAERAA